MSARDWLASRLAATRRDPRRIAEKLDAYRDEVLREAAEKQREALTEDPGLSEAALIDLIDPDKDTE